MELASRKLGQANIRLCRRWDGYYLHALAPEPKRTVLRPLFIPQQWEHFCELHALHLHLPDPLFG